MWERLWDIVLSNAGQCGVLPPPALLRCGPVSRHWRVAVLAALPTLRAVDFRGCEARITGPDVLAVLAGAMAGDTAQKKLAEKKNKKGLCCPRSLRARHKRAGIGAARKRRGSGKLAPCASMRPLRTPCVPALCAQCGPLLLVPAPRTPACPRCVHGVLAQFAVDMCMLEPMPAARARAVRVRAVCLRAGRVVRLCSVRLDRAAFARQRRRHRGGAPARALT
jgi:hypothetical protein